MCFVGFADINKISPEKEDGGAEAKTEKKY